ncbi:hypothetical protein FQN60_018577 [Etheostoma spectabile]|uniref:F5/8 type C domain-containing protein n=1 Tax=Etheostoma spectabile TaxID=54343 RepID=A0A5J5DIE5_9PERO|nr:hypothetical protein FQN60_018577 [Etheostoma spectabile]
MRLCVRAAGAWRLLPVLVLLTVLHVRADPQQPKERHYYIAAVEIDWGYAGNDTHRFGPTYKKVVFREYDDKDFRQPKPHPSWLGLLGPTLRAQEGEKIVVTFRNLATAPHSIHPHGIAYGKQSEGANYFDNTSQKEKEDDVVRPNSQHVYYWEVTKEVSPQPSDPSCLTYTYISHKNVVEDYNSGLIGALLICKPGSLDESGKQVGVYHEYVFLFGVFDENESKYKPKGHANHVKYTINGYTMGSLPAGMHGFVDVIKCDNFQAPQRRMTIEQKRHSREWTYYIAAEEIIWDYAPNMPEHIDEDFTLQYLRQSPKRIGGKYKKAVYTLFNNESFTERLESKQRKNELGILGPVIKAQIRDVIKIVFKNMASRPYSIYPHGLTIEKSDEGVNYPAGGNQSHGVQPGETHTYIWRVVDEDQPLEGDSRCLTRLYHSAVDTPRDIASGLIGQILICKSRSLNIRGVQNKSWYLDENIRQYCDRSKVNKADPDFYKSNVMHSINGYVFESGPLLGFCNGEIATWHVSSIGAQDYIQTATFYGHTFEVNGRTEDFLSLYPMTGETITMNMDNVGVWLMASLNSHETTKAMRVKFQDVECFRDNLYEYSDESMDFNAWNPLSKDEIKKDQEKPKPVKVTPTTNEPDIYTDLFADELGLRSLKNQSRASSVEQLDLSFLDYDAVDVPDRDTNITLNSKETKNKSVVLAEDFKERLTRGDVFSYSVPLFNSSPNNLHSTPESNATSLSHSLKKEDDNNTAANHINVSADGTNSPLSIPMAHVEEVNIIRIERTNLTISELEVEATDNTTSDNDFLITTAKPFISMANVEEVNILSIEKSNLTILDLEVEATDSKATNNESLLTTAEPSIPIADVVDVSINSTERSNLTILDLEVEATDNTAIDNDSLITTAEPSIPMADVVKVSISSTKIGNLTILDLEVKAKDKETSDNDSLIIATEPSVPIADVEEVNILIIEKSNLTILDLEVEAKDNTTSDNDSLITTSQPSIPMADVVEVGLSSTEISSLTIFEFEVDSNNDSLVNTVDLEYGLQMNSSESVPISANSSLEDVTHVLLGTGPLQNMTEKTLRSNLSKEISSEIWENVTALPGELNHTASAERLSNETELYLSSDAVRKNNSGGALDSIEEVLIYLTENKTHVMKTTNVKMQEHNWTYEETPQMESVEIPDYMMKYFGKENPKTTPTPKKTKKVNLRQRPQKGQGMKTKRRKEYKPQAMSGLPFSPRGFNPGMTPRGARPLLSQPLSDEEELINKPVVIGVPRPDFSDYELYVPGDDPDHLGLEENVKADEYEYVTYKDPYKGDEDIKNLNLDDTTKYYLKLSGPNVKTYFLAAEEVEWDYAGYGQRRQDESQPNSRETKFTKVVFRGYMDSSFSTPDVRGEIDEHLGILGPVIKAEVGQSIMERDIHSGLIGPLLVCREGTLNRESTDMREFTLLFMTFDESQSWYYKENHETMQRKSRRRFMDTNSNENLKFHSINGITYNLKGLRMYTKQLVCWYLINMGSPKDFQSVHFHGQTFLHKKTTSYRQAVYPLLPGSFATLEMFPSKPGLWQLETEVGFNQQKGMQTLFLVLDNECYRPLGLESGSVKDNQITAINTREQNKSWIQVDFQRPVVISQVATQGAKEMFHPQYVVKYSISYSTDRQKWIFYKGDSRDLRKVFPGNQDAHTEKKNILFPPVVGRFIRLHPINWYGKATVRMELYGCELDGCSVPLGMESRLIEDHQITASSTASSWYSGPWKPSLARLNTQGTINAWQAKHGDMNQWLQVELPTVKKITGIMTQGAKSLGKQMYVMSYALQYSNNGIHWNQYTDDESIPFKTFLGNTSNNVHVKNYIYPPIFSRFIRIIPMSWMNSITMRIELLGCDFE